ncbi:MAG TPA: neutral zinc metallopeptidase [Gemmatimonadaceae bacterium]|nr:neutral zinc metallopeptidase [Gemmatimonadaceae bacterium]
MKRFLVVPALVAALGVSAFAGAGATARLTSPSSGALRAYAAAPGDDDPAGAPAMAVTAADVAASNAKAAAAYDHLVAMWRGEFASVGARFHAPALARYRVAAGTACGVMRAGNASYCPGDNVIYYDEVFVAAQAKRTAAHTGTDGDMASVGIIAHEMGHAVAIQLGHVSRFPYEDEATADCLAGAFTRQADADGMLEQGDVDEAFDAMAMAGDPAPELTGDRRVDRRIVMSAALMGHGTYEQRMENFRSGLEGGAGACLAEFR